MNETRHQLKFLQLFQDMEIGTTSNYAEISHVRRITLQQSFLRLYLQILFHFTKIYNQKSCQKRENFNNAHICCTIPQIHKWRIML